MDSDLNQFNTEVGFNRAGHGCLRELERIANWCCGQCFFQGFGIGHAGGLISSSLGLQAGQLLVAELN
jgi:hypothetical protein